MLRTIAIETSCDDTSIGSISYEEGGSFTVEKLLAYSQIADHQKFGGVLPEVASRLHSEKIIAILQNIGRENIAEADFISATTHPGLPGSLVVGKSVATMLAEYFHKPLISVNHIHGHIFSILLERNLTDLTFPMVILTASGGHNDIYLVQEDLTIEKKAYTLDDASGEAFDKVSKMLGGPYPGGPRISEKASKGKQNSAYQFKRIFLPQDDKGNYPFSFSGMKSQVSFLLDKIKKEDKLLSEQDICDIAYEFQEATIETLGKRLLKVAKEYGAKTVAIAGGVSANNRLVEYLSQAVEEHNAKVEGEMQFLYPIKKVYSTDNGAMI
ncbi:MAG: tRNA (adenosine(37)-N6)-threonylcarbamoyltransferase complex transferase subunit TsaD [Candidatus Peribacteria bacterium]|jgi:N6-L-threonylcarbamoyladenine synthase|nr:tRNA (adenosine(37)-N6)-threonylcarbamoyltransferase complex transferase subunit TsaD [Candidatus Peribacteria bacterium]